MMLNRTGALRRVDTWSLAVIAATVIAIAGFAAFSSQSYVRLREERFDAAKAESQRAMLALVDRSTKLLDAADSYLRAVRAYYLQHGIGDDLNRFVEASRPLHAAEYSSVVSIIGHNGQVIFNTQQTGWQNVNVAALEHFKFFQSNPQDALFLDPTRKGKVTQKYQFRIVRPLLRGDEFNGDILLALLPEEIAGFFEKFRLGPNSSLSVLTLDHRLIARHPMPPDELFGKPLDKLMIWDHLKQAPSGTYTNDSPIDGITRHFVYQKLPDYPIVVAIGIAEQDVLGSLASARRDYIAQSLGFFLVASLFCALVLLILRKNRTLTETHTLLAESRDLTKALVNAVTDSFLLIDRDGRLLALNEPFARKYGHTVAEISGTNVYDLFPATIAEQRQKIVADVILGRTAAAFTDEADGRFYEHHIYPIADLTGEITRLAISASDVTESKRTEQVLKEAKGAAEAANKAKSLFLANMSHEIRTPMNAILGLVRILEDSALAEPERRYISQIRLSARLLLGILNDILDFSKIEAGQLELEHAPFALNEVLQSVLAIVSADARSKKIKARFEIASEVPPVLVGDSLRLQQVLINLAGNAVKFTKAGEVVVSARMQDRAGDTGTLEIVVRDTGIGIAPEQQERLFLAFSQGDSSTTRRYGGSGLGLAISKRLVTLMGGTITVRSELGQGSEFRFTIRFGVARGDAVCLVDTDRQTPLAGRLTGMRLLLVEDNEINQQVAQSLLTRAGATVEIAEDGETAVAVLRKRSASFDAVLMDVQMPGMDGYEATRIIRNDLKLTALPVIAMTANALPGDRERSRQAGMVAHLAKPIEIEKMFSALAVHRPARRTEPALSASKGAEIVWPEIPGIDGSEAARRLGGDRTLFLALLNRLTKQFGDVAEHIRADLANGNSKDALRRLHTLRGAAANLAARDVASLAQSLETAIKNGGLADTTLLVALELTLADLFTAISPHVSHETSPPPFFPNP